MAASVVRQARILGFRLEKCQRLCLTATLLSTPHRLWCSAVSNSDSESDEKASSAAAAARPNLLGAWETPSYPKWKDKEDEIFKDIEPIIMLTKDILHSGRYKDGEPLAVEDEKAVVENLLAYHPNSEDKIGCGIESILVDRHTEFQQSRCLFVLRTDGSLIDFSYRKCLREYIQDKYPSHAERFIGKHFRRWRG